MVKKNDVIFITKDKDNNINVNMPITRLSNIDSDADIKDNSTDEDYVPIIDTADNEQIKKIKVSDFNTPDFTETTNLTKLTGREKLFTAFGKLAKAVSTLIEHIEDNVKHITSAERTAWNGKAAGDHTHSADQIRGFPSSLPADGGNADTVGGYTAERLIQSNTNLLDNPDFKINQRGKDTYTQYEYTVDRWVNRRASGQTTVTVEDDGIRLTDSHVSGTFASLNQRIENPEDLLGKTVTVSCLITENESDCSTFVGFYLGNAAYANSKAVGYITVGAGMTGYFTDTVTLPNTTGDYSGINFSIRSYGGTTWDVKASWAKFEYGEVATPFVPPDPALELLKCQRFYQVIDGRYPAPITSSKYGAIWSINLPVSMRIDPTIILPDIDDTSNIVGTSVINGVSLGGWYWANNCRALNRDNIQLQLMNTDSNRHSEAYTIQLNKYPIAVSADL